MTIYVAQMFYKTLQESARLVAETKQNIANLSKNDFVLMGFGEHTSAIAFASNEPQANIGAQLTRIRGENFSLVLFEAAASFAGSMPASISLWFDRHKPPAPANAR